MSSAMWIDMQLEDVLRVGGGESEPERSVLMLLEKGGERYVPVWVGAYEGDAAAILLVGAETPRPLTFPFTARLLEAAGAGVSEVRLSRLVDETFFAEVVVKGASEVRAIDARPSDAIALALTVGAPIRADQSVVEQAGRTRAQVEEERLQHVRSARGASDTIRAHLRERKASYGRSSLF
jgi:uncharacterized protein